MLRRHGEQWSQTISSIVADRFLAPLALVVVILAGMPFLLPHISDGSLLFAIVAVLAFEGPSFDGADTMLFLQGRPFDQMPRASLNWQQCDVLQQSTGSDRILALNGYRAMVPRDFSSLLTRGKINHTHESGR
jgi:hypothetical protein